MPTPSSLELWQRIAAEGLASSLQCRGWAAELAGSLSAEQLADARAVLAGLVAMGKLTRYQAAILVGQSSQPLRRGAWHIIERVEHPLWPHWWVAANLDLAKGEPVKRWWARWLSVEELDQLRPAAPALTRGIQLANLSADHLQKVEMPELADGQLLLRVDPAPGPSLVASFPDGRLPTEQVLAILEQVATALAALHGRQIVHGRVTPDRIVWSDDAGATLVCDPLCSWTATADPHSRGILGQDWGRLELASFLAPEFLAPLQMPTMASDIYALGVTWWWLLTGQVPAAEGRLAATLSKSASVKLDFDEQRLGMPEPWLRCLQHCLAKNPSARFVSATELLQALQEARRVVARGKVSQPVAATPADSAKGSTPQQPPSDARPVVDRPAVAAVAAGTSTRHRSRAAVRRSSRRTNRWLLPTIGGLLFAAVGLLLLKWSGALDSAAVERPVASRPAPAPSDPLAAAAASAPVDSADPLLRHYRIVSHRELPWAPPLPPQPLELGLLPPGGQLFVSLRLKDWLANPQLRSANDLFRQQFGLDRSLHRLGELSGLPLEQIRQVTLAFYDTPAPGDLPWLAIRVDLQSPRSTAALLEAWGTTRELVRQERLWLDAAADMAYFLDAAASDPDALHDAFSIGSTQVMRDLEDSLGAAGPLTPQMQKLWERSNRAYEVCMLGSPRYLMSEGRGLKDRLPPRLGQALEQVLDRDSRAALLQTSFARNWYWELQLIGSTDADAPRLVQHLGQQASEVAEELERWFVAEPPHAYWRALAMRLPPMARAWRQQARFGVEDGVVVANGYLPVEAAANLLVASWIAVQPGATIAGEASDSSTVAGQVATSPTTAAELLERPISLRFAQESIERALALIGEEANDRLPAGRLAVSFELDGEAFEKAGITRNQQIRDFEFSSAPVRQTLTELVRRGNPITTVRDLREADQRLIWLLREDPRRPGQQMIVLTTREAAMAAGWPLPPEFAPGAAP